MARIKQPCPYCFNYGFVADLHKEAESFERAIEYAQKACNCEILVEDFIDGLELSVETLSANGKHFVIQTCEADNKPWLIYSTIQPHHLKNIKEVKTNGDREGYIIYKSTHKISMSDL